MENAFKNVADFVPGLTPSALVSLARQMLQYINQIRFIF